MWSSFSCFSLTARGRAQQQLLRLLVQREGRDLADVGRVGQQHHDPVHAGCDAAVRRGPEMQGPEHAAEALLEHLPVVAGDLERLDHDVGAVVTDRP